MAGAFEAVGKGWRRTGIDSTAGPEPRGNGGNAPTSFFSGALCTTYRFRLEK